MHAFTLNLKSTMVHIIYKMNTFLGAPIEGVGDYQIKINKKLLTICMSPHFI
jgi:hypothetical protein